MKNTDLLQRCIISFAATQFLVHRVFTEQANGVTDGEPTEKGNNPVTPGDVHLFNQTPITGRGPPADHFVFDKPEIKSGKQAQITRFPFVVSIIKNTQPVGVGVLLDKRHVLTLAYNAVYGDWCSVWIRAGSNSPWIFGQRIRVGRRYIHPRYNYTWEYNIAILVLRDEIDPNLNMEYVRFNRLMPLETLPYTLVGFGTNNLHWRILLERVTLRIRNYTTCYKMYNNPASDFTNQHICVPNTEVGPCYFNFGAPLLSRTRTLVALYIGTHQCLRKHEYGVYLLVWKHIEWIRWVLSLQVGSLMSNENDIFDREMKLILKQEYEYY